jgi:hypothetical protein
VVLHQGADEGRCAGDSVLIPVLRVDALPHSHDLGHRQEN